MEWWLYLIQSHLSVPSVLRMRPGTHRDLECALLERREGLTFSPDRAIVHQSPMVTGLRRNHCPV